MSQTTKSIQIFVYNTNIEYNYPIIYFSDGEELQNFLESLDGEELNKNKEIKKPYFVINNTQLLPDYFKSKRNNFYFLAKNKNLLKDKITSLTNRPEEFITVLSEISD